MTDAGLKRGGALDDSAEDSQQLATRKKIAIATAPNRRLATRVPTPIALASANGQRST
jgi:hypothetical protein